MELIFYGGASNVTGSAFLLKTENIKILIDCGIEQGVGITREDFDRKIASIPQIDLCIITHAHIDHIGMLPVMVKKKKIRKIISTPATKELARLLLYDFAKIQSEAVEEIPLFTEKDVEETFLFWDIKDDKTPFEENNMRITFYNNSHILGSVSVFIETDKGNYLFSGDIGTKLQQLMNYPPDLPKEEVDYLIIESTYGDKEHNTADKERLFAICNNICRNKGRVLIPAFAVGRLQEILYVFSQSNFQYPVYIDTPMGDKITQLIDDYRLYLKKCLRKLAIEEQLFTNYTSIKNISQSKQVAQSDEPCVVISASGMLEGGRILEHFKYIKEEKGSAIIFVGYQALGTRGRKVLQGEEPVLCKIEQLRAFSAHADKQELINYVERLSYIPYKIFIVHGEEEQRKQLALEFKRRKIRTYLPQNFSTENILIEKASKPIFINLNKNFGNFDGYNIMPFAGYIVEHEDKITIEEEDWYNKLFKEKAERVRANVVLQETAISEEKTTGEEIIKFPINEIEDNIRILYTSGVLSNKRLAEIFEEFNKGETNFLKYLQGIHQKNPHTGKRRWNPPIGITDEKAQEELYELAYKTLISLVKNFDKNTIYNILAKFNPRI